jgi:uncharacterized membrane protein
MALDLLIWRFQAHTRWWKAKRLAELRGIRITYRLIKTELIRNEERSLRAVLANRTVGGVQ